MKWKMLNVPLGDTPYGTSQKRSIGEIIGSAVGGVVSGVGNVYSQIQANNQNKELVRETNKQQKELFDRSLAWSEDMWNKSNAYNDPSAQVDRLLKAGINPAYVLGNGSMAEASPMSSPSAPSLTPPHVDAVNFDSVGAAAQNGVNTLMQSRMNDAQIGYVNAQRGKTENESAQLAQSMPYYVEHLQNIAKGEGWKADIARTELAYLQAINGQRISREFGNNRLLERQIKQADEQYIGYQLQNQLARVQLAYAPKLNEAQLNQYYTAVNEMKANISLTMARADLTNEQKLSEIEHRNGIIIDNQMKDIDKKVKDKTKEISIGLAREELFKAEDERYLRPFEINYKFTGKAGQWFEHPSGLYGSEYLRKRNEARDRFR